MNTAWNQWKKVSTKVAHVQAAIILFLFYFLCVVPLGVLMQRFSKDQSTHRHKKQKSYWKKRQYQNHDMSFAYEQ